MVFFLVRFYCYLLWYLYQSVGQETETPRCVDDFSGA